jgi:hypothetical protein
LADNRAATSTREAARMRAICDSPGLCNLVRAAIIAATALATTWPGAGRAQDDVADYPGLASCREHIEIAQQLDRRIVEPIQSPRKPDYACGDFRNFDYPYADGYAIYRVVNSMFCHEEYCYTFLYRRPSKSIVFSMDARGRIDEFHTVRHFMRSLEKIKNWRFQNTYAGIVLHGRRGTVGISISNDVVLIEPSELW